MFIFYSVNRQTDDNKDVNPSNCLNGYPGREKKNKNPIRIMHTYIVDVYNIYDIIQTYLCLYR